MKNWRKRILRSLVIVFLIMNIVAFFHAYKFTHFTENQIVKTTKPQDLSTLNKLKVMCFGVNNPRPQNTNKPTREFNKVYLSEDLKIECWEIPVQNSKGDVILFHGYSSNKSALLDKSKIFNELGYSTLLVDYRGSRGSKGRTTTIGFKEAQEVKLAFEYLNLKGKENIYLHGNSLGAVAIMKAVNEYDIYPSGIVIECPFGSLYQTVCARFNNLNVPSFPMAGLLTFWGGIQHGFWGFGHSPIAYAKSINCPSLLMYGEKDLKVSKNETLSIYKNLKGNKQLVLFPEAGHENYLLQYEQKWKDEIMKFLN